MYSHSNVHLNRLIDSFEFRIFAFDLDIVLHQKRKRKTFGINNNRIKMLSFKEMARSMNQKYPRAKHQDLDSDSETDQCRNQVVVATLSGDEDFL